MKTSDFGPRGLMVCRGLVRVLVASMVLALSACNGSGDPEPDADQRARAAKAVPIDDGGVNAGGDSATGESAYSEGGKLIRSDESLVALGNEMFGDRVGLYSGSLEFVQNDVSIPGNSALPVGVGRRHTVPVSVRTNYGAGNSGQFGDWDLEIPHMHGVFSLAKGWTVDGGTAEDKVKRCSQFGPPPAVSGQQGGSFNPDEYWQGTFLYAPGSGSQEVLTRSAGTAITDGGSFPLTTKDRWVIRCGVSLRNSTGEGFIAISPDGTQYTFDVMVGRLYANYIKGSPAPDMRGANDPRSQRAASGATPNVMAGAYFVKRKEYWILPSEIKDRHGKKVTYVYDASWRLSRIEGEEVGNTPRRIDFGYDPVHGRVSTVTAGSRTWTYTYRSTSAGQVLAGILLPDGSRWTFNLDTFTNGLDLMISGPPDCEGRGELEGGSYTGTMTHPSGATGSFTVRGTRHGRTFVERYCRDMESTWPSGTAVYPLYLDRFSIVAKSISGPGLPINGDGSPKTAWTYAYSPGVGCTVGYMGCDANSPTTKTVTVTNPEGDQTRYTFGIRFRVDEGQLLLTEEGLGTSATRVTERRYANPATGPWPDPIGTSIQRRGNGELASRHAPENYKKVTQQGVDFLWQGQFFDGFAKPTQVLKQGPSGTKDERTTYSHNTNKWVLSQPQRVWLQLGGSELEIERHDYDPSTANRLASYSFGLKKQSFTYNGDGTLATKADGLNNATSFFEYKRGLAQRVVYADINTERATVDDFGLVGSVTNAANTTTNYGYDAMGRLSAVTHPTGDAVVYNATTVTYEQRSSAEYGLAAGHWVQTTATGNARTERYFDAQWRPMVTRTYDAANEAGTRSVTLARYDSGGRKSYESYPRRADVSVPVGTLTDDQVAASNPGIVSQFDALGRIVRKTQSDAGSTYTAYLSGFQRQTTNPRNYVTTHGFQAFDEPKEDSITSISAPEGVTVQINRDLLGKATSITRSGGGKSVTRSYVYDGNHRLCKTVEPETGSTVQLLDAADNVTWRASGLNLPSIGSCDQGSATGGSKISFGYDARNRLKTTTFGDGQSLISRDYAPDGRLAQIVSGSFTWTYVYNNRRLLTQEQFSLAGQAPGAGWNFVWGIDQNGHVSSLTDPWGGMAYSPDALGRPTQVSGYATGVGYHPNGTVAGYTLANGIVHTVTLNTRGLPEQWRDAGVVNDLYGYDANGNVTGIQDLQEGISTRGMAYDGLDRLTSASGVWGIGSFGYDALDNLVSSQLGGRTLTHGIDAATNRLTSLSGNQNLTFGYDANGNITARGAQGFTFDTANRMRSAWGKASYDYDGHGRRTYIAFSDGKTQLNAYTGTGSAGRLLFSQHSTKGVTRYVYLGDKLIAEGNGVSGTSYTHTDALGSPVARTNGSGQLLAPRTRYDPYGATAAGTDPEGIGFTGHVNDPDTGLVYMQQRYMDPIAGRFLSVDPVTTESGSGDHFNRYVYALNNPYKYNDSDGRIANFVWGAAVGFVIEAGSQMIASGGTVTNWTAVGVATGVGALTGGVGGFAASAASKGAITAGEAVKVSAATAGLAAAVGKNVEAGITGQPTSPTEVAASALGAALGAGGGTTLATKAIGSAEKAAASKDNVVSGIGKATLGAIQKGGAAGSVTAGASKSTQQAADVVSGAAGKKLEDATK